MNVLVAGDFCPEQRVADLFRKGNYDQVLSEVKPIVEQADYSIVNFECPVCIGNEKPIEKCGPNLNCSEEGIEAVKWAGFDCVTLANNHFLDYGKDGVMNTLNACRKHGIQTVGGGLNLQEASRVVYVENNKKKLAIINCCEHEYSIATETTAGSNPLNPVKQYYVIQEARKNADYVLVIVHGGHEHYQLPSIRMQETYRFFINAGADAVVNHHQHCYSGFEFYNAKPIVYGLGNFCFDEGIKSKKWHEGYIARIIFGERIELQTIPYIQCKEEAKVKIVHSDEFENDLQEFNKIISSPTLLEKEQNIYYESVRHSSMNVLNPVVNRYFSYLQCHHLLPSIVSEKWLKIVHNHIMCEAHRDKLLYYLSQRNKN